MRGNNLKRAAEFGDGSVLKVQKIFKTLQGEGPNVGVPAIFVRLGGCNLACTFCDTDFEEFVEISLDEIIFKVRQLSLNDKNVKSVNLVVVTGGEPFRQEISLLCDILLKDNYALRFDGTKSITLFDIKNDPMLTNNLINKETKQRDKMEAFIKAVIQQYNNRIIENKLTISN